MALEIVTINTPDFENSGYLFSKNPLYWQFQRQDFQVENTTFSSSISNNSGKVRITIVEPVGIGGVNTTEFLFLDYLY